MFTGTLARTIKGFGLRRPTMSKNLLRCVVARTCLKRTVSKPSIQQCRCLSITSHVNSEDDQMGGQDSCEGNETTKKTEEEIREEILENALNHVHTHGWSRQTLATSAEELGYPSIAEGIFSRGESELVLYFIRSCNKSLELYMERVRSEEEEKKTSDFIRDMVEHRLRMIIPYIDSWPDAMAVTIKPPAVFEATKELANMVDDIWFYAGDKSTDFNWYTKRGILAKLYASTQLVMLNDQSPDFNNTWEFLDRRMKDVATFGKVVSTVQRQVQMVADVGFAGFTVLRNVAGLGEQRR